MNQWLLMQKVSREAAKPQPIIQRPEMKAGMLREYKEKGILEREITLGRRSGEHVCTCWSDCLRLVNMSVILMSPWGQDKCSWATSNLSVEWPNVWALLVSFALYTLILQNRSLDPGLPPSHCPALRGTHCRSRETKRGIIISKVISTWSTDHSTVAYPVFFSLSDTSEGRLHHILKAQGSFCLSDLPSLECSLLPMVVVRSPSLCIPGKRRKREARRKG